MVLPVIFIIAQNDKDYPDCYFSPIMPRRDIFFTMVD
jgi:hypothetical protein